MNMSVPYLGKLLTALKGRTKTQTLLNASFMHGEHDAFKEHIENNPVRQDFNGALKQGIKLVLRGTRTMSDVAPTLEVLLKNGAKWGRNVRLLPTKVTPYHVICDSTGDHHELLELMIKELGRKLVNSKDYKGSTALIFAVKNANVKCVKSLIANGADVNFIKGKERHRFTWNLKRITIMVRSVNPLIESIKLLLYAESPHSLSTIMDIFDLLLDSGADVNQPNHIYNIYTPVMYAAETHNAKCVQKLIQRGAQLNPVDNWKFAAQSGSVDLLKYLLEDMGIDKNSIDKHGRSVLFWTVVSGNIEAIRYLLHLGVTTTPYHLPQKYVEPCNIHVVGAVNLNTRFHYLRNIVLPFEFAASKEHSYVAEMLLAAGCSCGVHSSYNPHYLKANVTPEVQELLKKWEVDKNNVISLQQRCRMVILNQLSPQADKKIVELPLPPGIVKYLSFPELDGIIDVFKNNPKLNYDYIH